jgi:uncharacterized membrane protein
LPTFHGTEPESIRRRLAEIAEREEEEREDRRASLRTLALLVLWPAVALAGMGWGFQMNDPVIGQTVFYLSLAVGDLGILGTLVAAWFKSA